MVTHIRLLILISTIAGVCFIQRDMETVWTQCPDGYRAVEHHDKLDNGGFGSDNNGNHWTVHHSRISPEEWTNY